MKGLKWKGKMMIRENGSQKEGKQIIKKEDKDDKNPT